MFFLFRVYSRLKLHIPNERAKLCNWNYFICKFFKPFKWPAKGYLWVSFKKIFFGGLLKKLRQLYNPQITREESTTPFQSDKCLPFRMWGYYGSLLESNSKLLVFTEFLAELFSANIEFMQLIYCLDATGRLPGIKKKSFKYLI